MKPITIISAATLLLLIMTSGRKDDPVRVFPKEVRDHYAHIPQGAFSLEGKTLTSGGFYISKYEVTNSEYREFLLSDFCQHSPERVQLATPDTTVWNAFGGYMDPYREFYFFHPAYWEYPVVGVSTEGAELYCQYLAKQLSSISEGVQFSAELPDRTDWVYAAKGGMELSPYPWGGPYLRNAKGCYLANFSQIGDGAITLDKETGNFRLVGNGERNMLNPSNNGWKTFADVTAPVKAFVPNDYDLYNMAGNVAEMVKGDSIVCGGGWRSGGYDLQCHEYQSYSGPASDVGFRPLIRVKTE